MNNAPNAFSHSPQTPARPVMSHNSQQQHMQHNNFADQATADTNYFGSMNNGIPKLGGHMTGANDMLGHGDLTMDMNHNPYAQTSHSSIPPSFLARPAGPGPLSMRPNQMASQQVPPHGRIFQQLGSPNRNHAQLQAGPGVDILAMNNRLGQEMLPGSGQMLFMPQLPQHEPYPGISDQSRTPNIGMSLPEMSTNGSLRNDRFQNPNQAFTPTPPARRPMVKVWNSQRGGYDRTPSPHASAPLSPPQNQHLLALARQQSMQSRMGSQQQQIQHQTQPQQQPLFRAPPGKAAGVIPPPLPTPPRPKATVRRKTAKPAAVSSLDGTDDARANMPRHRKRPSDPHAEVGDMKRTRTTQEASPMTPEAEHRQLPSVSMGPPSTPMSRPPIQPASPLAVLRATPPQTVGTPAGGFGLLLPPSMHQGIVPSSPGSTISTTSASPKKKKRRSGKLTPAHLLPGYTTDTTSPRQLVRNPSPVPPLTQVAEGNRHTAQVEVVGICQDDKNAQRFVSEHTPRGLQISREIAAIRAGVTEATASPNASPNMAAMPPPAHQLSSPGASQDEASVRPHAVNDANIDPRLLGSPRTPSKEEMASMSDAVRVQYLLKQLTPRNKMIVLQNAQAHMYREGARNAELQRIMDAKRANMATSEEEVHFKAALVQAYKWSFDAFHHANAHGLIPQALSATSTVQESHGDGSSVNPVSPSQVDAAPKQQSQAGDHTKSVEQPATEGKTKIPQLSEFLPEAQAYIQKVLNDRIKLFAANEPKLKTQLDMIAQGTASPELISGFNEFRRRNLQIVIEQFCARNPHTLMSASGASETPVNTQGDTIGTPPLAQQETQQRPLDPVLPPAAAIVEDETPVEVLEHADPAAMDTAEDAKDEPVPKLVLPEHSSEMHGSCSDAIDDDADDQFESHLLAMLQAAIAEEDALQNMEIEPTVWHGGIGYAAARTVYADRYR